jgi:hypothetical protein
MTYCVSLHLYLNATLGVGPCGFVADLQGRWSVMKETVQFFRDLAKGHRQLAGELHNEELIRDLRISDKCETKAEELTRRLKGEESIGSWPTQRLTARHRS